MTPRPVPGRLPGGLAGRFRVLGPAGRAARPRLPGGPRIPVRPDPPALARRTPGPSGRPTRSIPDSLFVAFDASAELGAISPWAGPSRPASWTSTPSSATGPTASPRRTGPASRGSGLARPGRHRGGREGLPGRPGDPGRALDGSRSERPSSTTARPASRRWPGCSPRCSPRSTSPGPCSGAATWRPWPGWSMPASRSTSRPSAGSGAAGGHPGRPDPGGRRPVRRVRRPDVPGRSLGGVARAEGHRLAPARIRGAGPGRRHVPGDGPVPSRRGPDARASASPSPSSGSTIWRSGPTGGTGRCSARSPRRRAGTSRPTRDSSSGRRAGSGA